MTTLEYHKQAADFLADGFITFDAALIGSDCPRFCEDARKGIDMDKVDQYPRKTHIHGKHYRCTLEKAPRAGKTRKLVIDFWNSYNDEEFNAWKFSPSRLVSFPDYPYWDKFKSMRHEKRKLPTPYDVLTCITKSDPGTFEQFCDEFGYDNDSRRAEETWRLCQDEWRRVQAFFTPEEIEKLQEIQ